MVSKGNYPNVAFLQVNEIILFTQMSGLINGYVNGYDNGFVNGSIKVVDI
jgi:hypothetical protein